MVMEAVAIKVSREDEKARKDAEDAARRKQFKQDTSELESFR